MRVVRHLAKPMGYVMYLSANDTYAWAHKAGACWPCSRLSNHRAVISVDSNGLYDLTIDGRENAYIDADELQACVSDHLSADLRHLWPVWEK